MRYIFSIVIVVIATSCFAQQTYEAKYQLKKIMPAIPALDSASATDTALFVRLEVDVIANNIYSLVVTKVVEGRGDPIALEAFQYWKRNGADSNFIDYSKNIAYHLGKSAGLSFLSDSLIKAPADKKIVKGYQTDLYYLFTSNKSIDDDKVSISKKIPWFINPGVFYNRKLGGVILFENSETQLELLELKKAAFDFSGLVNRSKAMPVTPTTEGRFTHFF